MSWSLAVIGFLVGITAELGNLVGVIGSITSDWNYWPPGERDWQFYLHWSLEQLYNVSILVVTYFTWNRLDFPRSLLVVAGGLFVLCMVAALYAGSDLGREESMGLEGELRTGGLYQYSRNPQYVFYVGATITFAIFAASPLVAVMSVVYLSQWFLFPLAEEPWLREQYGDAYDAYAGRTPRFIGRETYSRIRRDAIDLLTGRPSPQHSQ